MSALSLFRNDDKKTDRIERLSHRWKWFETKVLNGFAESRDGLN
jgi:hypothetical protein